MDVGNRAKYLEDEHDRRYSGHSAGQSSSQEEQVRFRMATHMSLARILA